ncbi:hypothetical protein [Methyloglobulus sp.]|uniref:hypothetical protein n=1 Tax=Methyloglobulus sp. TaxID=2518622 RepID=UPI0017D22410|nr:hypothetical protein [Methyloglobulus sp.]
MRKDTAEYIDALMRELLSWLNESTGVVKDECSAIKRKPIPQIMALSFDVLGLIYRQYPELMPTE